MESGGSRPQLVPWAGESRITRPRPSTRPCDQTPLLGCIDMNQGPRDPRHGPVAAIDSESRDLTSCAGRLPKTCALPWQFLK